MIIITISFVKRKKKKRSKVDNSRRRKDLTEISTHPPIYPSIHPICKMHAAPSGFFPGHHPYPATARPSASPTSFLNSAGNCGNPPMMHSGSVQNVGHPLMQPPPPPPPPCVNVSAAFALFLFFFFSFFLLIFCFFGLGFCC